MLSRLAFGDVGERRRRRICARTENDRDGTARESRAVEIGRVRDCFGENWV